MPRRLGGTEAISGHVRFEIAHGSPLFVSVPRINGTCLVGTKPKWAFSVSSLKVGRGWAWTSRRRRHARAIWLAWRCSHLQANDDADTGPGKFPRQQYSAELRPRSSTLPAFSSFPGITSDMWLPETTRSVSEWVVLRLGVHGANRNSTVPSGFRCRSKQRRSSREFSSESMARQS